MRIKNIAKVLAWLTLTSGLTLIAPTEVLAVESVAKRLTTAMQERLREHFNEVVHTRTFQAGDVTAGRAYVKAYVEFIHYVERVYEATTATAHGHFDETEPAAHDR